MLALAFLLMILSPSTSLATQSAKSIQFRIDLKQALHGLLCQKEEAPSPQELWSRSIYDTQAEISWISGRENLTETEVRNLAWEQASEYNHEGYSFGLCNEKRAWILTTHASSAIIGFSRDMMLVDTSLLTRQCKSFQLDFAANKESFPEKITDDGVPSEKQLILSLAKFQPGTISLTCQPINTRENGPELWALIPVGGAWPKEIQFENLHSTVDLITWIQSKRKAVGLNPLKLDNPRLKDLMTKSQPNKSVQHPRTWLLQQKQKLAASGLLLLGENRVKAKTHKQIAWLLWHSARHRRFLLSPTAEWLSYTLDKVVDDQLFTMHLARTIAFSKKN